MFVNRQHAGHELASQLTHYKHTNTIVYALPRGGVILGNIVAEELGLPLDIILTKKIGHPLNPEYAICAITEDGQRICDENGLCGVEDAWIESEIHVQKENLKRRRQLYCGTKDSLSPRNKNALLVDDGIATGLTIKAAVHILAGQNPKKIIIAAPVAPGEAVEELRLIVDEVVVIKNIERSFGAVGSYYTRFPQVTDEEVMACLTSSKQSQ